MIEIKKLTNKHLSSIKSFCNDANLAGFKNNSSIESMKFGGKFDLGNIPTFWGLFLENKLISVSGCHYWKGDEAPVMRCLFRSAALPDYKIIHSLSKNHMNSIPFSLLLPYQIKHGIKNNTKLFFITTSNSDHDASGKMKRTHRAMELLSKNNIVSFESNEIIYSTLQTKWKINLDNYLTVLRNWDTTRQSLNIKTDKIYQDIIENGFQ